MSKVLMSLPVGDRVGIAFSGGLDTSAAVAWMRERGAIPYTYTADLGQYDEPDLSGVPDRAKMYGAEEARLIDCREELVREGLMALQCGAFHIRTAGRTYFNTTPLGRAVTGTLLVRAMKEDGVDIWGDGSTYKGNDIERFYRYGAPRRSRRCASTSPGSILEFNDGARRTGTSMSAFLADAGTCPTKTSAEKAYSTDANMPGAPRTRRRTLERAGDVGIDIVDADHGGRPLATRTTDDRHRTDVTVTVERGTGPWRSAVDDFDWRPGRARSSPRTAIGGRHGLGTSDQIENRDDRSQERGASTRRPGMALIHIVVRAPPQRRSTTRRPLEICTPRIGRRLGRLLYEGRWFDPSGAAPPRRASLRWVAVAAVR